jgi:Uma2 family endonuclease
MNAQQEAFRRHRLSVADYFRMGEVGILSQDARVELINGEIIEMAPIGSNHSGLVNQLTSLLVLATQGQATVSVQNPVILGEYSAPQPDLCLLKLRTDHYRGAHPQASDILLAIEVADSSLRYDREIKVGLYAAHQIPEVWLIDVPHGKLHTFSRIEGNNAYREITAVDTFGLVRPLALPQVAIDLKGLF